VCVFICILGNKRESEEHFYTRSLIWKKTVCI